MGRNVEDDNSNYVLVCSIPQECSVQTANMAIHKGNSNDFECQSWLALAAFLSQTSDGLDLLLLIQNFKNAQAILTVQDGKEFPWKTKITQKSALQLLYRKLQNSCVKGDPCHISRVNFSECKLSLSFLIKSAFNVILVHIYASVHWKCQQALWCSALPSDVKLCPKVLPQNLQRRLLWETSAQQRPSSTYLCIRKIKEQDNLIQIENPFCLKQSG